MWIDPLESARLYLSGLASLHLRRRVATEEVDWLLGRSPPVTFSSGQTVFKQGEWADVALLVVHGVLEVVVDSPDGEKTIGTAGAWDVVGETALFAPDQRRSATVRALRDSTCLLVGQKLLQEGRDNAAVIAIEYHLLHTLTERVRVTNQALHEAWVGADERERTAERPKAASSRKRLLNLLGGGSR